MTCKEILTQIITWLQEDGRVPYRALRRQFDLDDYLEDITYELIDIQHMFACLPGEDRR